MADVPEPGDGAQLRLLTPGDHSSFLELLSDQHGEGLNTSLSLDLLGDHETFVRYCAAVDLAEFADPPHAGLLRFWALRDSLVGRLVVRHHPQDPVVGEQGNIGYYVRPGSRRLGVGRAMLLAGCDLAVGRGLTPHLVIKDDNLASKALARSAGFEHLGRGQLGEHWYLTHPVPDV